MEDKNFKPASRIKNISTKRIGINHFAISEIYSALVSMSWSKFFIIVFLTYFSFSLLFTLIYAATGFQYFSGLNASQFLERFWLVFLYNAQTLSTVGGAGLSPIGVHYNFILTIEAMIAMLGMAIITGLLYVRFSKPLAEVIYSKKALISPYKQGKALMLRIANGRKNELVGITATVYIKISNLKTIKREIKPLKLEREMLPFLASSWTIVHPIENDSPLSNMDIKLEDDIQYDISIWLNGMDETTGQNVFSGHTYLFNDIIEDAKFLPCIEVDEKGNSIVHLDRVSDYEKI